MTHPMSEPWLDWQPMSTFPRDGNGYLVCDDRTMDNFEAVFWDDDSPDGPTYHVEAFTHWARVPLPHR